MQSGYCMSRSHQGGEPPFLETEIRGPEQCLQAQFERRSHRLLDAGPGTTITLQDGSYHGKEVKDPSGTGTGSLRRRSFRHRRGADRPTGIPRSNPRRRAMNTTASVEIDLAPPLDREERSVRSSHFS